MNSLTNQILASVGPSSRVVFDLWWVVFRFSDGIKNLAIKLNIAEHLVREYWLKNDDDMCRGKLDPQDFLQNLYREFTIQEEVFPFLDFWVSNFSPISWTHKAIHELISKGIDIHILSNIYPGVFPILRNSANIPHIPYKIVVESCTLWYVKPEQEIYEHTEKLIGARWSDILFIDDSEKNLESARKRGWKCLLFTENNL